MEKLRELEQQFLKLQATTPIGAGSSVIYKSEYTSEDWDKIARDMRPYQTEGSWFYSMYFKIIWEGTNRVDLPYMITHACEVDGKPAQDYPTEYIEGRKSVIAGTYSPYLGYDSNINFDHPRDFFSILAMNFPQKPLYKFKLYIYGLAPARIELVNEQNQP